MKLRRIEFIIATAMWIFSLILIYSMKIRYTEWQQVVARMGYATVIYAGFMLFNGWICYDFFKRKKIEIAIGLSLLLFFAMWVAFAGLLWVMRGPDENTFWWFYIPQGLSLGISAFCFLCFAAYEGIKAGAVYLQKQQGSLSSRIAKESLIVLGIGIVILFLLLFVSPNLAALWMCLVPYAYMIFAIYVYWLLPMADRKMQGKLVYGLVGFIGSFILFLPFGLLFLQISRYADAVYFVVWFAINIVVIPLSYYVYSSQKTNIAQLTNLRQALGQSTADVRFLRSQINPHFLFNILNTLYGIALQENAERTSAGIQKLGDMMRFMLHENNEDRILLTREIDYLKNYIDLQLLRTATSPDIQVTCDIQDSVDGDHITPMLLIPFVENAFKHGISLQEKSWIQVSLRQDNGQLFFDVHNSIHSRVAADPERDHGGIGLSNVKQRLEWVYPGRHELVIRQTAQEFFIHLTISL